MPSKIRVLSDHTINKIAAGEVIENPASVVKELTENALDAGATDICIEIAGGGRELIRISDNGLGMNADDALLCLERHATSKISEVEEIHTISTMGFRGEAVPSIASISKFSILTRPEIDHEPKEKPLEGTMVIVDGGKIVSSSKAIRSQGTTIEVKSLFFNVPVRKKFLKSPTIDANEIQKIVSLIALGNPSIKFQLIIDGKKALTCSHLPLPEGSNTNFEHSLRARASNVLGNDYIDHCVYIDLKNDACHIRGLVGLPNYTRHNRTGQYLFINKRGIVSQVISYAVKDGYGSSLQAGRHPVFILHLTLDGSLVDVNVHPQKREVRLRHDQMIRDLIMKGIQGSLQKSSQTPQFNQESPSISPVFAMKFQQGALKEGPLKEDTEWVFKPKSYSPQEPVTTFTYRDEGKPVLNIHEKHIQTEFSQNYTNHKFPPKILGTIAGYILIDSASPNEFIVNSPFKFNEGSLILINQRAAHSRIIFEKLLLKKGSSPLIQQTLLTPYSFEASPYQASLIRTFLTHLNSLGIAIKEFGNNTFLVDAIPQIFGNTNIETLIADIIHNLEGQPETDKKEDQAKKMALAASKSAVSISRKLTLEEALNLLSDLIKCEHPYQCPSGKQVIAQISTDEIAKYFTK